MFPERILSKRVPLPMDKIGINGLFVHRGIVHNQQITEICLRCQCLYSFGRQAVDVGFLHRLVARSKQQAHNKD